MVCVHGVQSHGGWYVHSCRRMAEAGFDVYFLDRRGSGLNERDRGDTPTFRRLLFDIIEFLEAKNAEGPAKTFLLGISWGGKTAVGVEMYRPGLVDGLVLLCPGFFPRVSLTFWDECRVLWARGVAPRKMFPVPLSDPTLFTANEKWLTFLRDDPLSLRRATARFLCMSAVLDFYLRKAPRRVAVPTLLLLAGRDRIIDNDKTRRFVGRFAGPTEVIEYPEAHHTLEFEPDPERHIADVVGWLRRQAGAAVTTTA